MGQRRRAHENAGSRVGKVERRTGQEDVGGLAEAEGLGMVFGRRESKMKRD
jgi:hypothetical protein